MLNQKGKDKWTPIRVALQTVTPPPNFYNGISFLNQDNDDMARLLIKKGVSPNFTYGTTESTPIHWAAKQNNVERVRP